MKKKKPSKKWARKTTEPGQNPKEKDSSQSVDELLNQEMTLKARHEAAVKHMEEHLQHYYKLTNQIFLS